MKHLAIIIALFISYAPMDSLACEQRLVEENGRVAITYVPRGCEYGPWANMDVKIDTCDPKIKYYDKTRVEKVALKCDKEVKEKK